MCEHISVDPFYLSPSIVSCRQAFLYVLVGMHRRCNSEILYMQRRTYVRIYVCMYVCMCVYKNICIYAYMHTYIYIYIHACICVYIYIHIHIYVSKYFVYVIMHKSRSCSLVGRGNAERHLHASFPYTKALP